MVSCAKFLGASLKLVTVLFVINIKKMSHHFADACTPRTSHFHCSFGFALVLHS